MNAMKVVIVGGGTMGLAAAWALARTGRAVTLLERFEHVHALGSHGGHTRIIRHAYHESSDYVSLVSRADAEWTALGARAGQELLVRCGLLEFGAPDHPDFQAAMGALVEHDIPHELLDAAEAGRRYPFVIPSGWGACLSPDSGYLRVRACLDALRREAEAAGAQLRYGARVRELILGTDAPGVLLEDGAVIRGDHLIVAAGARTAELFPGGLRGPGQVQLAVYRRVLAWALRQTPALRDMPTWGAFVPEGFFYGFPDHGVGEAGAKLACHSSTDPAFAWLYEAHEDDADQVDRRIHARDLEPLRAFVDRYLPSAAGGFAATTTCLYTNTPSEDFWIDRHPEDERVTIASGFSGHGFKFAPAIGLMLADLATRGRSELWLERFSTARHLARV
ncbi:Sarcosine oxidase [Plesiocystis pacifica SIR-1]|uniref:Sarcosine oxidase n=2 Tax=Plesiocystis pacifica TaxID=191768 RepID=A6GH16_9BACT|nr:Sarcosine oxidase [Plesiocystis pacifica SIR-1]